MAILGGIVVVLFLRKSDADRIRDTLHTMAEAVRFSGRQPTPAWLRGLRTSFVEYVADPVTISIAPFGDLRLSTDKLLESVVDATVRYDALGVTLNQIGVKVAAKGDRATANGEVLLETLDVAGARRSEPRKFVATFAKHPSGWKLIHLQTAEPHVDQPEARP